MNHNHSNYQARLDFVNELLSELDLGETAAIVPVQYDPECPFKYNNFVYRVTLTSPIATDYATNSSSGSLQPGCVPIPKGTKELIVRLTNPAAEGLYMANRVENEVAIISLASTALRDFQPHVVPQVYGWGSAAAAPAAADRSAAAQGWILQELLPGRPLDEAFHAMSPAQKKPIFAQMAALLKALQTYKLPDSITGFGGVTFDDAGRVVSAPMPTVGAGPWTSYEAHYRGRVEEALWRADENPYIKGWDEPMGTRDRLHLFVDDGVAELFEGLGSKEDRVVVHGDFNASNLLFDPDTRRITGLIDYDFASILHPSYEFLRSFIGTGGQFKGWDLNEESDEAALRHAKLHGFPSPLPPTVAGGDRPPAVNWEDAKAWEDALEVTGAQRPRTMPGIDKVADVDRLLQAILPWRLTNPDILKQQTHETIMQCRKDSERHLHELLSRLGY